MRIPLGLAPENRMVRVVELRGGRGLIRRLSELGFLKGEWVRVLKSGPSGPALVEVKGSRIALGRGVLMRIIVECVPP